MPNRLHVTGKLVVPSTKIIYHFTIRLTCEDCNNIISRRHLKSLYHRKEIATLNLQLLL